MDKKVDDGLPLSGKVIAMYGSDWGSPGIEILYSDTPSLCVLPGPPVTYNIRTRRCPTHTNVHYVSTPVGEFPRARRVFDGRHKWIPFQEWVDR